MIKNPKELNALFMRDEDAQNCKHCLQYYDTLEHVTNMLPTDIVKHMRTYVAGEECEMYQYERIYNDDVEFGNTLCKIRYRLVIVILSITVNYVGCKAHSWKRLNFMEKSFAMSASSNELPYPKMPLWPFDPPRQLYCLPKDGVPIVPHEQLGVFIVPPTDDDDHY